MPIAVSDSRADWNETIEHGAKTLGRSKNRIAVFRAVYTGKKNPKTVGDIAEATRLSRKRVLTEGKRLADEGLVQQTKRDGDTAYEKVRFYQKNRDRIMAYAEDPSRLEGLPTKRRPSGAPTTNITVGIPRAKVRAKLVTVDDIPALAKVRKINEPSKSLKVSESKFKGGIARLLSETGRFRDWGGERNDLSTTRLRLAGQRREAAFAFKGPGTKGVLTPAKMGKNGDQIQRLALSPAEVFVVQYWSQVGEAVREQLANLVRLRSFYEERPLWYGVIDGDDTRRLLAAYPTEFGVM